MGEEERIQRLREQIAQGFSEEDLFNTLIYEGYSPQKAEVLLRQSYKHSGRGEWQFAGPEEERVLTRPRLGRGDRGTRFIVVGVALFALSALGLVFQVAERQVIVELSVGVGGAGLFFYGLWQRYRRRP